MKKTTLILACIFILITQNNAQTVTDIDGNVYNTVTIGTQTWMKENYKVTKFNDGTPIPLVTNDTTFTNLSSPAYCWYNNLETNKDTYGAIYHWRTVLDVKLAPVGWHIPTIAEWIVLQNYLIANTYNYDATNVGNKIAKSMSAGTGWEFLGVVPGAPGNTDYASKINKSGFSAVPSGYRSGSGSFTDAGKGCVWFSAEATSNFGISYSNVGLLLVSVYRGASVRCIKDNVSGIDDNKITRFKVTVNNKQLMVSGISIGETINIYNLQGIKVYTQKAIAETISVTLPTQHTYIVKVGEKSVKVVL